MARPRFLDMMQAFPFWLFDASAIVPGDPLFSIFDPSLGFSAITAPEITIETRQIQPGNWEYKRQFVKTASASPITLSRGARFFDSDFYNWITRAIRGAEPVRRDLFLVHFLGFRPLLVSPDVASVQAFPPSRIPGRAWVLYDCIPTRYKAGTDFDANSSDVSIQELEVQPEHVIEVTTGTTPTGGRGLSIVSAAL